MVIKRPFGLRSEIVISTSLLVGAALLFVALLLLRLSENRLLEQTITLQSRHAQSIRPLLKSKSHLELITVIENYAQANHLQSWNLRGANNQTIAGNELLLDTKTALTIQQSLLFQPVVVSLHYPTGLTSFAPAETVQRYFDLSIALPQSSQRPLLLHMRYSLDDIYQQLMELQTLALVCCLGYGLVLVITAVYLLNRSVILPIIQLTKTTQQISQGDLKQRVTLLGPREITTLGQSFNHMAQNLQYSMAEQQRQLETLQQTNDELHRTQQQLVQSDRMASVGNLTSGMAHELGNPLSAVIGYLELLKKKQHEQPQLDLVNRALIESGRMDQLLKDMLDFAAPSPVHTLNDCDPAHVVAQTCEMLHLQGVLKNHTLTNLVTNDLPQVSIDPHKLQQVFVNLILNARDATSGDQMEILNKKGIITLRSSESDGHILLSVQDNGHGMDEKQQLAIFDPFFTTKEQGKGRGLGLYVCYQLVKDCGGQIEVNSVLNEGSCFTITLPIKRTNHHESR